MIAYPGKDPDHKRGSASKLPRNITICEAYNAGKSLRELGAEHKVSHSRIQQILQANGVKLRKKSFHHRNRPHETV